MPKLDAAACERLLPEAPGWALADGKLARTFRFRDFAELMRFVNRMAELAENEGHHPDFTVHWNVLDVSLWTHSVDGLTGNDFILAAKIGALRDAS